MVKMSARFHRLSNGKLKFKRNLNLHWESLQIKNSSDVLGRLGSLERAILFSDPTQISTDDIILNGTKFEMYSENEKLTSSTGRLHKIVHGQFFKSQNENFEKTLIDLTSTGAWSPSLPDDEYLQLEISNLKEDVNYELRLIFSCGKRLGANSMTISPGDFKFNIHQTDHSIVAIGKFISNENKIKLQLNSNVKGQPPFINSMVLRKLGESPKATGIAKIITKI